VLSKYAKPIFNIFKGLFTIDLKY